MRLGLSPKRYLVKEKSGCVQSLFFRLGAYPSAKTFWPQPLFLRKYPLLNGDDGPMERREEGRVRSVFIPGLLSVQAEGYLGRDGETER